MANDDIQDAVIKSETAQPPAQDQQVGARLRSIFKDNVFHVGVAYDSETTEDGAKFILHNPVTYANLGLAVSDMNAVLYHLQESIATAAFNNGFAKGREAALAEINGTASPMPPSVAPAPVANDTPSN